MRYALCAMRPPSSLPSIFLLSAPLAPRPFGPLARTDREPAVSLSHSLSRPLAAGRATDADGALSLPSFLIPLFGALGPSLHLTRIAMPSTTPACRSQPASQPASLSLSCDRRRNSREREERRSCKRAVFSPLYRPVVLPHRKREKEGVGADAGVENLQPD